MNKLNKHLLIIAHTPSSNTQTLAQALLNGAKAINTISSQLLSPFDACAEQIQQSDALILFTTENFGYMNGALKDFFERIYYPCLEATSGIPYSLVIRAGLDGTGSEASIKKIVTGLKWREVQAVTLCKGQYQTSFEQACYELGMTMAAGLDAQIF